MASHNTGWQYNKCNCKISLFTARGTVESAQKELFIPDVNQALFLEF